MKIRHYPGKAVVNDPAWLEMDIPNSTRGLQYEANWLDTQKTLTASSSNSWDSKNSQDFKITSKLGKYQNTLFNGLMDDTSSSKASSVGSLRLKYHSDKYLSLANTKPKPESYSFYNDEYYLPSQTRLKREPNSDIDMEIDLAIGENENTALNCDKIIEPPKPKPRKKLQNVNKENYNNVISDLEKQIKKSVRFNDKSTEISFESDFDCDNKSNEEQQKKQIQPEKNDNTSSTQRKFSQELTQDRINDWIDDQNKYIVTINLEDASHQDDEKKQNSLTRNDSGYYENTKRVRQRFPPKKIYPSSESSTNSANSANSANCKSDSDISYTYDDTEDIYKLYKNGHVSPLKVNDQINQITQKINEKNEQIHDTVQNQDGNSRVLPRGSQRATNSGDSDFSIPRPKLIVPVHSYGVRKRKTGNLQRQSFIDYDKESVLNLHSNMNKHKSGML